MYPYNNNNYYPQQAIRQPQTYINPTPQIMAPPGLKGRMVSSLEEARATSIDFDGSVFYFPDLANKKIYTKQINMDGTATLNMYELKEGPTSNNSTYVTREEFNNALNKIQMNFNLLNNQQEPPVAQVPPPEPAPEETQNAPTYKF